MTNLLSVPFKKSYVLPIRQGVRDYISTHHKDTHPDVFKWDIDRWETLRKDATDPIIHTNRVQTILSYHAQLVFILTKLPSDIGLEIAYAPVFSSGSIPVTLKSLIFERTGVLFNLAALYSQLACAEDRTTLQGLKQMIAHLQAAAGTFRYLISFATPSLYNSVAEEDMPLDLTEPFLASLESLMLAQAQEGVWQRAMFDNYKNGVVAKLAAKVSSLYNDAVQQIKESPIPIKHIFPSGWVAHLETKQMHFAGVAQFRKSIDDLEANRYGQEIARLVLASSAVRKGHEIGRKGKVLPAVLREIQSLVDAVQENLTRAEKDNDLIYHQEVPAASSLPQIKEVGMVQSLISEALADPKTALGNDTVIFGELLGYGAKVAIEIYEDRRKNWIDEEVLNRAQQLDNAATGILQSLNLPAALEAMEKPVGLPPSLLKKAEEVRSEDGPTRVQSSINNVRKLAEMNMGLLNETLDILDQEADNDEVLQADSPGSRVPSAEANKELVSKATRYRQILDEAAQSDELVRGKWDDWEQNITELTWSEEDLQAAVPSSSISLASAGTSAKTPNPTRSHARQLRSLLESLDDIQRSRVQIVDRAKRRVDTDDITPRILKVATAIERWVEVKPSMFEDVVDEEMEKFEKFKDDLEDVEVKQEMLLESIKERNEVFIQSRKEDPSVKDREHALQSLDLAYHMYKEITRNLDEGLKFYNEFGHILAQFRATCKDWLNHRQEEMQ
ncbi:BRO1-domain-containing protein [Irpex rosettiformis]|uniref:BRO1-domain-containing protein n=1 Tax=Irpex rosettiformis TaxID=378272 RepID=A0ACB8UA54_9APHY|nr:BRO1-domain-containing protein [Irpex rosettiformis]